MRKRRRRVEKPGGKWHATFYSEPSDQRSPPPGNSVPLPLIHRVPKLCAARESVCDGCAAAKLFDQVRMLIHIQKSLKLIQESQGEMSELLSNDSLQGFQHHVIMPRTPSEQDAAAIGLRFRRLRFALGYGDPDRPKGAPPADREYTLEKFAVKIGLPAQLGANRITQYEAGKAIVQYEVWRGIRDAFKIPDVHLYLFEDRRDVLPQGIYEALVKIELKPEPEELAQKPRRGARKRRAKP